MRVCTCMGLKDDEIGIPTGLEEWDAILIACFAAMAMRRKPMRFTEGSSMLPRRVTTTHNCTTSQETKRNATQLGGNTVPSLHCANNLGAIHDSFRK